MEKVVEKNRGTHQLLDLDVLRDDVLDNVREEVRHVLASAHHRDDALQCGELVRDLCGHELLADFVHLHVDVVLEQLFVVQAESLKELRGSVQ